MKKIFLLILFSCSFFGCKKNPFDYRTKYLGNYNFIVNYSSWNGLEGQHDTTYVFNNGKIDYGTDKNTILIFFDSGSSKPSDELTIYEDGSLGCGEFVTTEIIKYTYYQNQSPMSHSINSVSGEKK